MKSVLITVLPFFILLIPACSLQGQDFDKMVDGMLERSIPVIYVDSLQKVIQSNKKVVILDAREPKEFQVSHIQGAVNVGYSDFNLSKIPGISENSEIIVYCSVGYRSERIGEKLVDAGFRKVTNLYGGVFAWKNNGYSVVGSDGKATEKIHAYSDSWGKWLKSGEKVYD